LESVPYPLKAVVEDGTGGVLFLFGENVEDVAAPQAHAVSESEVVSGNPFFSAADALAYQKQ